MHNSGGLQSAARQLQSYGRGPDTMLAHISPDEARLIDYMQGGRKTNPLTGLPEYGVLGKLLKGIARAAGGIAGFMIGGPAGAALGSGIATKLTGGNWKQSLAAGALGGIGAGVGNMASGAGFMGTTGLQGAAAGSVPLSQLGNVASQTVLPTGFAGSLGAATSGIGGLGGLGAGLGGFMGEPRDTGMGGQMPALPPPDNITYNPMQPVRREYVPFEGDLSTYGERGGEHKFFRELNVPTANVGAPPVAYGPMEEEFFARGGKIHLKKSAARRAVKRAMSPAAKAGAIRGPGGPTDDMIPAQLSNNEHVIDAEVIRILGKGNPDKGHAVIEKAKRAVRKSAGIPAPYKPAAARAMKRAGVSRA